MIFYNVKDNYLKESLLDIKDIVENKYYQEILETIGSGCSADVYGYDDLAIKVFNGNKNGTFRYREDDHKIYLKLANKSNYFPKLYAYVEQKYMVVDLIEGFPLSEIGENIKNDTLKFDLTKFYENFFDNMGDIVDYCFKEKIIPFDMHDDNIIVKEDGSLCIVDLGYFEEFSKDINSYYYRSQKDLERCYAECMDTICRVKDILYGEINKYYKLAI